MRNENAKETVIKMKDDDGLNLKVFRQSLKEGIRKACKTQEKVFVLDVYVISCSVGEEEINGLIGQNGLVRRVSGRRALVSFVLETSH